MIAFTIAIALVAASEGSPPAEAARSSYTQSFANGTTVDWSEGYATVMGFRRVIRDIRSNAIYYKMTQREAEQEGYKKLFVSLGELAVDSGTRLQAQPDLLARFRKEAETKPASSILMDQGPVFQVLVRAPLRGEGGLMKHLLPEHENPDNPSGTTAAAGESSSSVTGVLIDARHLDGDDRVVPALLPRVVDTNGRVVHGIGTAGVEFARDHGLITYQAAPVTGAPPGTGREGEYPIRASALRAQGDNRTDIVIDPEVADRIAAAAAQSPILKECRVVVLMPPPLLPPPQTPPAKPRAPGGHPRQPVGSPD